jgi:hypothetical protein
MDPQLKAAIQCIYELRDRVKHLEGQGEGRAIRERTQINELQQLRKLLAERTALEQEVARLQAQRDGLFILVGRMRAAQRLSQDLPVDRAVFVADLDRALQEIGAH